MSFILIRLYLLGGVIHVIVNKYDKYIASDPYPMIVKYVSFASFNNTPIEYFYNCTLVEKNNMLISKPEKLITHANLNESMSNNAQEVNRTPYTQSLNLIEFSAVEFAILVIVTMVLTLNIVILYYVFILAKYID